MSKRLSVESKIGCYHVIQRGVAKQILFEDERDYRRYYERLCECVAVFSCEIVAYCLMSNHVHLLIRSSDAAELSRMMQKLGTGYAKYFNTKYDRSGMTRKQIELLTGVSKTIQKRVCRSRVQRVQNIPFMPGVEGA